MIHAEFIFIRGAENVVSSYRFMMKVTEALFFTKTFFKTMTHIVQTKAENVMETTSKGKRW